MAQTTGAISQSGQNAVIEVNLDSETPSWQDVSGSSNTYEVSDIEFQSGEAWTFGTLTAIITRGNQNPCEITVNGVYTEEANELWDEIKTAKSSASGYCQVRFFPKGKVDGEPVFTSQATYSIILNVVNPTFDASEGGPVPAGMVVKTADLVESTYTT